MQLLWRAQVICAQTLIIRWRLIADALCHVMNSTLKYIYWLYWLNWFLIYIDFTAKMLCCASAGRLHSYQVTSSTRPQWILRAHSMKELSKFKFHTGREKGKKMEGFPAKTDLPSGHLTGRKGERPEANIIPALISVFSTCIAVGRHELRLNSHQTTVQPPTITSVSRRGSVEWWWP